MESLCIALLVAIATFLFWFCAQRAWTFSLFKRLGLPGPPPSFIYGNLKEIRTKGTGAAFEEWSTKYGDIVGYFHGSIPAVLTRDPEMIKQVFVKDSKKVTGRQVFTAVTQHLPLNQVRLTRIAGQDWRDLRGLISPAFKASNMKQAVGIMIDRSNLFVEMIEAASVRQQGVANLHDHAQRLAMDAAMGVFHSTQTDVQRGDEMASKLLLKCRQCTGMFGDTNVVYANCISELPFLFRPLLKYAMRKGVPMEAVLAYFGPIIDERRKMDGTDRNDLLQTLFGGESEDCPSIKRQPDSEKTSPGGKVHPVCRTRTLSNGTLLIIAAIDSVASPLAFATYLLAMHQEVQDRLREEVLRVLSKDGEFTYDNICGMDYLGQVISETLRMYPSLHGFVQRACDNDYEYKGMHFPKGTVIGVPVLKMHYDPRFWEEPEKFDPESQSVRYRTAIRGVTYVLFQTSSKVSRFADAGSVAVMTRFSSENKHKITAMAYLPYGAGPRNCIAMRYGELFLRVSVATLVARLKLLPSEEEPKTRGSFRSSFIVLVPEKGIWLRTQKIASH